MESVLAFSFFFDEMQVSAIKRSVHVTKRTIAGIKRSIALQ